MRKITALLAPCAALLLALASRADDASDLDEVFKKVDEKAKTLTDLKADMRQEKTMAIMERPIVCKGKVSVKKAEKGTRMCWETWDVNTDTDEATCPRRLLVLGDEKKLIDMDLEEKNGEMTDLGKGKFEVQEFLAIGTSLSGLKKSFDIELSAKPTDTKGWELKLTPTSERMKLFIKEMRLEIDPKEWVVSRIFVLEATKDTIEIKLSNYQVNKGVDDALFKVPDDMKLQEVKLNGK